ncbi:MULTISPECIES: hypothetical protein [Streptomyces]|uniref:hypothetical protein n=1 Tax=Streptomyces TaxID=1883 RepID=UPI00278C2A56|nr:hypothetical protein [Streptomyces hydrogenans]
MPGHPQRLPPAGVAQDVRTRRRELAVQRRDLLRQVRPDLPPLRVCGWRRTASPPPDGTGATARVGAEPWASG